MTEGMQVLSQLDKFFVDNNYLMEMYIKKADAFFNADLVTSEEKIEKYKEAKKIYEQLIENFSSDPKVLPLYFKAAECSKKLGLLDEAVKRYQGVINNFPDSPDVARAEYEEGLTLVEIGRFEEARREYLDVIKRYPKSPYAGRAYFKLADSYRTEADKIKEEYNIQ